MGVTTIKALQKLGKFVKIRDNKLIELYKLLTGSDFKGSYEDTYIVELLYALMCVDLASDFHNLKFMADVMYDLAIEIIRIFETDDNKPSSFSIDNWTYALIQYMKNENVDYKAVHKMSTVELRDNVRKYLELED